MDCKQEKCSELKKTNCTGNSEDLSWEGIKTKWNFKGCENRLKENCGGKLGRQNEI